LGPQLGNLSSRRCASFGPSRILLYNACSEPQSNAPEENTDGRGFDKFAP